MPYDDSNLEDLSSTPFDDVFKLQIEKMGQLLVPVIERMFHVTATVVDMEEIERLANERFLLDEEQRKISKRFSDSCYKIAGGYYHVECQSTEDGSILFRLAEYNVRIALDGATKDGDSIRITLPNSGLIKLRGTTDSEKSSEMKIIYRFSDQEIVMPVPVLNVQAYSADDIYDGGLFFLIPYYLIRFENRLRKISDSEDPEYVKIYSELREFVNRLIKACEDGIISEDNTRRLAELSNLILNHIASRLNKDLRERMAGLMSHVIELQEDRWLREGELKGLEKGRLEGTKSLLFSLVKDKLLDISIAAERAGESEEDFTKELEEYIKNQK
ncbi:hypothetical protein BXO88_13115 [Oribacterium sp. C9]|uniref:hypothetical protein n=1 Tax=Oribacterium sp. C9 TaxID=1943579 RepID=UPI00098E9982|nr:hypothetical protein [Oribacterium sp. C9]OON85317.1 hypothetical protein BXO88_13115 [Oribacterium sp. C9]